MLLVRSGPAAVRRRRSTGDPTRPLRLLGTTGALLMAVGAPGAGAGPVPDPLAGLRLLGLPARNATLSLSLAWAGAAVLVLAWLAMGRALADGTATPGRLLRAAVLWATPLAVAPPLFSRDVYSYLAQGAIVARGFDPYAVGPGLALGVDHPLVRSIPTMWRDTPSPYGPLFLGISRMVTGLTGDDLVLGVLAHRAVALGGLALVVWALPALARRCGADPLRALWFGAANPLVLFHLVSGAHNEALMLGLMLAGLELGLRAGHRPYDPRLLAGAGLIVAGSAVKLPAAVALGVLGLAWARSRGGRRSDVPAAAGVLTGVAVAGYALLSSVTGVGTGWVATLGVPTSVHSPFSLTTDAGLGAGWLLARSGLGGHTGGAVGAVQAAGGLVAVALVAWCLWAVLRGRLDPVAGLAGALGAVVVLGPAGQPWYVLWGLLPLVATRAWSRWQPAVLVLSAVLAVLVPPTGSDFGLRGYQLGTAIAGAVILLAAVLVPFRLGSGPPRVVLSGPCPTEPRGDACSTSCRRRWASRTPIARTTSPTTRT